MTTSIPDENTWRRLLAPYKKPSRGRALTQLLDTAVPFALVWFLMAWSVRHSYLLTLLLAIPAAGLLVRLFIIQHDCGHGSFFRSRRANHLVGGLLGIVTLTPYGYWRRTHAIHHATSGNLDEREMGDINTITVEEYVALPFWRRLAYRLYRNPVILFGLGPVYQFMLKQRFPFDIPWAWKREWRSVLVTNAALGTVGLVLISVLGWQTVVLTHLPIALLAGTAGVWLFYVQHQFEETSWEHKDSWDFYRAGVHGSSFYDLPRVLHWFSGNIGYHHIHHLSSQIPNYNLPSCFRDNPALQDVTRLTLLKSLHCIRLKLWDEESRSLIGFRDLARRRRLRAAA